MRLRERAEGLAHAWDRYQTVVALFEATRPDRNGPLCMAREALACRALRMRAIEYDVISNVPQVGLAQRGKHR